MEPAIRTRGLSKAYGATQALLDVDFEVAPGEVRALMGRNGAGKSTMVKILSGNEKPDAGKIELGGKPVSLATPDQALLSGIATVHQEITVIPGLTVAENVTLGRWATRGGMLQRRRNAAVASAALQTLGADLPLDRPAGDLRLAEQQLMEIARAISHDPRVLILDEPTSSLTEQESERLTTVVRHLAEQGVAVVYVSHRMEEIEKIADSVTVMRDGQLVRSLPIEEASVPRVAELMAGVELAAHTSEDSVGAAAGEVCLRVNGLSTREKVRHVDLELRRGEVVGLVGRLGSGRTEILRAIAGLDACTKGVVEGPSGRTFGARDVKRRVASGVALVSEDRKGEGIVLNQPVLHNMVLSALRKVSRGGILVRRRELEMAQRSRDATEVRLSSFDVPVSSLSGGNQQKIVFARCLNAGVEVLLLDEPTRGVDIQSKHQIYDLVHDFVQRGCAVLLVSSEYGELLVNCDRVLLVDKGALAGEIDTTQGLDGLLGAVMSPSTREVA